VNFTEKGQFLLAILFEVCYRKNFFVVRIRGYFNRWNYIFVYIWCVYWEEFLKKKIVNYTIFWKEEVYNISVSSYLWKNSSEILIDLRIKLVLG